MELLAGLVLARLTLSWLRRGRWHRRQGGVALR